MIDIGFTKIALIGAVALVFIGPEKLPRVARTIGTLLGKAQRYIADVKNEVSKSIELDELKKMKDTMQEAASDVENSIHTGVTDFEKDWNEATSEAGSSRANADSDADSSAYTNYPTYSHPKKKWRVKQGAVPNWYKARTGVRTKAMSGAARVAKFRPAKLSA
ncbi:MAG: Sec-independent protein translocase subunit TatB [Pseudomonadota bacterium]